MKRLSQKFIGECVKDTSASVLYTFLTTKCMSCGIFNKVKKAKKEPLDLLALMMGIAPKGAYFGFFEDKYQFYKPTPQAQDTEVGQQWFKEATECTMATLPRFLNKMLFEIEHLDPGSGSMAIAAIGLATMHAGIKKIDLDEISGSLSGMMVMREWMGFEEGEPVNVLRYRDLLTPGMELGFNSIPEKAWEWVKKEAMRLLDNQLAEDSDPWTKDWKEDNVVFKPGIHPDVLKHWRSVAVDEKVPFGLKRRENEDTSDQEDS